MEGGCLYLTRHVQCMSIYPSQSSYVQLKETRRNRRRTGMKVQWKLEQLVLMKSSNLIVHYNQVMGLAPVARHPPFHFIPFLVAHFAPSSPHTLHACLLLLLASGAVYYGHFLLACQQSPFVDLLGEQGAGNLIWFLLLPPTTLTSSHGRPSDYFSFFAQSFNIH